MNLAKRVQIAEIIGAVATKAGSLTTSADSSAVLSGRENEMKLPDFLLE